MSHFSTRDHYNKQCDLCACVSINVPRTQTDAAYCGECTGARVGARVRVWWTVDKKWYPGTIESVSYKFGVHVHDVQYDDGALVPHCLDEIKWETEHSTAPAKRRAPAAKPKQTAAAKKPSAKKPAAKKQRIAPPVAQAQFTIPVARIEALVEDKLEDVSNLHALSVWCAHKLGAELETDLTSRREEIAEVIQRLCDRHDKARALEASTLDSDISDISDISTVSGGSSMSLIDTVTLDLKKHGVTDEASDALGDLFKTMGQAGQAGRLRSRMHAHTILEKLKTNRDIAAIINSAHSAPSAQAALSAVTGM